MVNLSTKQIQAAKKRLRECRIRILEVSQRLTALHVAPAFSCLELVDTAYYFLMSEPISRNDTFILSKGHGAMAQYAVLETLGVMSEEEIFSVCQPGSKFGGHPDRGNPGVIASTGSLGHGLPIAIGMALAKLELHETGSIFLVMSDGEFMEGSTWESLMLAPTFKLNNLIVLIDHNKSISRGKIPIMHPNFLPLKNKIEAFGWEVFEVDGHDTEDIYQAFMRRDTSLPLAIIGNTIKGKGVSFMENEPIWAYRSPNKEEFKKAVSEINLGVNQNA